MECHFRAKLRDTNNEDCGEVVSTLSSFVRGLDSNSLDMESYLLQSALPLM